MKRFLQPSILVYIGTIIWINLLIILYFGAISESDIFYYVYNTDFLFLPSLYQDVIVEGGNIQQWHFTPAPYFFPDMALYFLLRFTGMGLHTTTIVYSCIQVTLILVLLQRVIRNFIPGIPLIVFACSNLLCSGILLQLHFTHGILNDLPILLNLSNHNGAFLSFLLCVFCIQQYIIHKKFYYLPVITIIIALALSSDKLFLVMSCIPISLLFIWKYDHKIWHRLFLAASVLAGVIGGFILFGIMENMFIIPAAEKLMYRDQHLDTLRLLLKDTINRFSGKGFNRMHIILFMVSFVLLIILGIRKLITEKKIPIFSLFWLFFITVVFLFPGISGLFKGPDCIRYNYGAHFSALFLFPVVFTEIWKWKKLPLYCTVVFLFIFVIIPLPNIIPQLTFKDVSSFLDHYPKGAKLLDENSDRLLNGVGEYWETKYIEIHSKKGIKVRCITPAGNPYFHESNEAWFLADKKPAFNFYYQTRPDTAMVTVLDSIVSDNIMIYITEPFCFHINELGNPIITRNCD